MIDWEPYKLKPKYGVDYLGFIWVQFLNMFYDLPGLMKYNKVVDIYNQYRTWFFRVCF